MFICPECNVDVDDPDYVRLPRKWWERRALFRRKVPVCPSGHKLRGILGDTTDVSLSLALWVGFRNGFLFLLFGLLEDLRFARHAPRIGLPLVTAVLLLLGVIAFSRAWDWAGMDGPVHRLTARACGMAIGYLVAAVIASHAIYFRWALPVEDSLVRGMGHLIEALWPRWSRVNIY